MRRGTYRLVRVATVSRFVLLAHCSFCADISAIVLGWHPVQSTRNNSCRQPNFFLPLIIPNCFCLQEWPYVHGKIDRASAEKRLRLCGKIGCFLVRVTIHTSEYFYFLL